VAATNGSVIWPNLVGLAPADGAVASVGGALSGCRPAP